MNIARHVERGRRLYPERPALVFEDRTISYARLDELAARAANALGGLGIREEDRVALLLPNIPAFVYAYLGILKLGAIAVSLNVMLKTKELAFFLGDSGARIVITTEDLARRIPAGELSHLEHVLLAEGGRDGAPRLETLMDRAAPIARAGKLDANRAAAIVYTSGTTGLPLGVTLSHGNVVSNIRAKTRYTGMRPEDRVLLFVPMFHCFGQNAVLNSVLNTGATAVLMREFSLDGVLEAISRHGVTMFFGVPTTYILLLECASPEELRSVRYYFSAAATMPREVARRWRATYGVAIHEGYGLTETSPFASYNHETEYRLGSIGTPIEGVEMKIVDVDDGRDLPDGEIGEIAVRGPNVMLGYWNRPEETRRAIVEGWFHTGDLGHFDGDGYFFLVDRLKDMINVAGLKVYPAEVEDVLYGHAGVSEAAVIGAEDAVTGERVEARVVARPGHAVSEEALLAHCRREIASYKVPSRVEFVASLPKNATGKVLRRMLR
jgi:long-chain acyl-CoA synthetase